MADELRRNAEEILHDIPPVDCEGDEGDLPYRIMWHRGAGHERLSQQGERLSQQGDGPQNYVFLYRRQDSNPEFEILDVHSNEEMASLYARTYMTPELSI